MKAFIKFVLLISLTIWFCAGCSKEMEKTPAQVNNDVVALLQQNKVPEALEIAENALKKAEEKYGKENPSTAEYLQTLAMVYSAKKDIEKAESNYKKALSIITENDGQESIDAAKVLNNLASLFYLNKNYVQAVSYYKQSLAIVEKNFSPGDPRVEAIQKNIKICEDIISGKTPAPSAVKKDTASPAPDLVPEQIKEAALSDFSKQNIYISGLVPQPIINMNNKGVVFPYFALKSGKEGGKGGVDEKVVILFAAKKDAAEQNKYIFQQCRMVPFQSYMSELKEGGIDLLKKELVKLFPGVYS